jgi:hypothetical protein
MEVETAAISATQLPLATPVAAANGNQSLPPKEITVGGKLDQGGVRKVEINQWVRSMETEVQELEEGRGRVRRLERKFANTESKAEETMRSIEV